MAASAKPGFFQNICRECFVSFQRIPMYRLHAVRSRMGVPEKGKYAVCRSRIVSSCKLLRGSGVYFLFCYFSWREDWLNFLLLIRQIM